MARRTFPDTEFCGFLAVSKDILPLRTVGVEVMLTLSGIVKKFLLTICDVMVCYFIFELGKDVYGKLAKNPFSFLSSG